MRDLEPDHINPLPGENGIRLEYRTLSDTTRVETVIARVAAVYSIACERYSWAPELCRIVVRDPDRDGGTAWTVRREWLPDGPADELRGDDARGVLERVEASAEVLGR